MEESPVQKQFLESYDELSEAIFRHCFFRVSDRELALDLMQESFLKTWKYLSKGNDINDVRAFVYRVANNLVIDHYRKKKTISLDSITEDVNFQPTDNSFEDIISESEFNTVMRYVNDLDEPYKQAIIMKYIDGLPPQEIAEIIGESPNNVSVRIVRGLEKIRSKMK